MMSVINASAVHAGETFTLASDWPGGADPVPRTGHLHELLRSAVRKAAG
jgi:hypothetical protein